MTVELRFEWTAVGRRVRSDVTDVDIPGPPESVTVIYRGRETTTVRLEGITIAELTDAAETAIRDAVPADHRRTEDV